MKDIKFLVYENIGGKEIVGEDLVHLLAIFLKEEDAKEFIKMKRKNNRLGYSYFIKTARDIYV